MMILAFFGNDPRHADVMSSLEENLRGFVVEHLDLDYRVFTSAQKHDRVQRLITSRHRRDTVTIVTGISMTTEHQLLAGHGALFCVLPGVLPALLSLEPVAITDQFVFVSVRPSALDSELKRRRYMTPLEAFSECYRRDVTGTGKRI